MKVDKEKQMKGNLSRIKERLKNNTLEITNFVLGTLFALIITFFLTFIEIWQLIIIPGIVAGIFNNKMKRGSLSGAISVSAIWALYILVAVLSKNAYVNIEQFAGLIFGALGFDSSGFGWIIILLILLFGALFGALGGAIGSGLKMLIIINRQTDPSGISEKNNSKKS